MLKFVVLETILGFRLVVLRTIFGWRRVISIFFCLICRIQNPDTPRAGRVGAAHGGAAGRGGAGSDGTPVGRSGQETTLRFFSSEWRTLSLTSLRKHEQSNSYLNLSNPKPGHTTGASGRGAQWGGGAGPGRDADRTVRPQDIEDTSLERLSRSTNKRNPM